MSEILVNHVEAPYPFEAYAHVMEPLPAEEGGGFLITFPDLPGCMSDGKTEAEAMENARDAFSAWISAAADLGDSIPVPHFRHDAEIPEPPGRIVQRIPISLLARLQSRSKTEGVSLDTLLLSYIAEGLGRHEANT